MQYNKVEFLGDTFDPALPPKKPWLAMKTRFAFDPAVPCKKTWLAQP